jgi:hypothetical protein
VTSQALGIGVIWLSSLSVNQVVLYALLCTDPHCQ